MENVKSTVTIPLKEYEQLIKINDMVKSKDDRIIVIGYNYHWDVDGEDRMYINDLILHTKDKIVSNLVDRIESLKETQSGINRYHEKDLDRLKKEHEEEIALIKRLRLRTFKQWVKSDVGINAYLRSKLH